MTRHRSASRAGEHSDVRRPDDGGLTVLDSSGERLYLTPPHIARALRYFVARVQGIGEFGLPQTLALTSPLAREGVSYVAKSLAAVIAHDLERKVCVVETNWWKPTSFRAESAAERPGLAEVLAGDAELDAAMVMTTSPQLGLLGAGRATPHDRPVLARSSALADLLADISKEFDTVVLDLPPVLSVSESISLARHADAIALVVRQGVTSERQVRAAVEELEGSPLLGIILNGSSTRIPRFLRRFAMPS